MFRKVLSLILAALTVLALTAPGLAEEGKLIVGMELAYPPFEMTDTGVSLAVPRG